MNRKIQQIIFLAAISSLIVITSAPCFADDCPEVSDSMLTHAKKYIKGYDIADLESFSEEEQEKIYEVTKSRCFHITQLGSSTYSILFKNKKTNSFILIVASAYDRKDHPWGFHRVDTFKNIPIVGKIDLSRKYINKISKEEVEATPSYRSLTVSFLNSSDHYIYTLSKDSRKYIKHKIEP